MDARAYEESIGYTLAWARWCLGLCLLGMTVGLWTQLGGTPRPTVAAFAWGFGVCGAFLALMCATVARRDRHRFAQALRKVQAPQPPQG